jgi:hypothetical protein
LDKVNHSGAQRERMTCNLLPCRAPASECLPLQQQNYRHDDCLRCLVQDGPGNILNEAMVDEIQRSRNNDGGSQECDNDIIYQFKSL